MTTAPQPLTVADSAAIAARALVHASHHRIRPAGLAVLMALAAGNADSQADLVAATGLSPTGVRVALQRLTGRGRWLTQSQGVPGLADPLVYRRPHPHGRTEQQFQYLLTPAGENMVLALLGLESQMLTTLPPSGGLT